MKTLKVTSNGRVTLSEELLDHLGIAPGGRIFVERMSGGRLVLGARPVGHISAIFGSLEGASDQVLSIDEITEATKEAWAGLRR